MRDHRKNATWVAAVCYFIAFPFLILVEVANTHDRPVLRDLYFFRLDVANVIPLDSGPNAALLNSVARSLGLHDFYQTALWNYCEGYNDEGITYCSTPKQAFWFNPVEVISNELLAGAKIALPTAVLTILDLLRIGQQAVFTCFLVGTVLTPILCFSSPLVLRTRRWSIPIIFLATISGLVIGVATVVATIFSLAAKYALTLQSELNIGVEISPLMLASMWIPTVAHVVAFFLHSAVGCCCYIQPRHSKDLASLSPRADMTEASSSSQRKKFTFGDLMRRRKSKRSSTPGTLSSSTPSPAILS